MPNKFFMKYTILILLVLFFGCMSTNVEQHETVYEMGGAAVKVVIIDSCQYLYCPNGNATWCTHKGNCSNHINKKPLIAYNQDSIKVLETKVLDQYLEDNYGKCTLTGYTGEYIKYKTPKGEVLAHITKDNIISVFKLEKRFGAEEY